MKKIAVGKLKAHLSECLKNVQKGETYLVLSRDHPVAQVIPVKKERYRLRVSPATRSATEVDELLDKILISPRNPAIDSLELLLQERGDR